MTTAGDICTNCGDDGPGKLTDFEVSMVRVNGKLRTTVAGYTVKLCSNACVADVKRQISVPRPVEPF